MSHVEVFHWGMDNLWSNQSKIIHLKEEKKLHLDGITNPYLEFRQQQQKHKVLEFANVSNNFGF